MSRSSRKNTIYVHVILRAVSLEGIGVVMRPDDTDMIWLPKSQIDWEEGAEKGERIEVGIPEWLAAIKDIFTFDDEPVIDREQP